MLPGAHNLIGTTVQIPLWAAFRPAGFGGYPGLATPPERERPVATQLRPAMGIILRQPAFQRRVDETQFDASVLNGHQPTTDRRHDMQGQFALGQRPGGPATELAFFELHGPTSARSEERRVGKECRS